MENKHNTWFSEGMREKRETRIGCEWEQELGKYLDGMGTALGCGSQHAAPTVHCRSQKSIQKKGIPTCFVLRVHTKVKATDKFKEQEQCVGWMW